MKQKLLFHPLPKRDKFTHGECYWIVYDIDGTYPHFVEARWDENQDVFWSGDNVGMSYNGVYGYLEWDEIEIEVNES